MQTAATEALQAQSLQAVGLVKKYGGAVIVDHMDLRVGRGEVVGLLGANGAGKTTSFNLIIGLTRPSAGRIMLGGEDISRLPMHMRARRGVGYLPQEHSVFRALTAEQNILAVLEARMRRAADRKTRAQTLLQEFGIWHLRDQPARQLSGGEQRRVEIARALACEPNFILLDEPFAGVDPLAVRDIQHIIGLLKQRGLGLLITDHNVRETLGICDRAYILHRGRVLAAGTPAEIMANATAREVYLGHDFSM